MLCSQIVAALMALMLLPVACRPRPPQPPITSQVTWLYANSLPASANFIHEVIGLSEAETTSQSCRIWHASPGDYLGVCDSSMGTVPQCHQPETGDDAVLTTYALTTATTNEVIDWYSYLNAATTVVTQPKVHVETPTPSKDKTTFSFRFFDPDHQYSLGCYRFVVQTFNMTPPVFAV
eukprot:NODE_20400_length_800_cov_2.523031.p2 GENE.NODE_20400_length_800_cov_2.523031~~NODE_20400_length_800_cov_2.523031.p2  ORF type:complete len:178 (-),score=37.70 NODE_20400_length_800_cov_2.523031:177-710(-)